MRALGLTAAGRLGPLAPLLLRLGLGVIFIAHGAQKMQAGPANFGATTLAGLGVPAPGIVGWLVALAELGGGLLILIGLLTRLATLPPIGVMIGALVLVKSDIGLIAPEGAGAGAELDLALLTGLVALLIVGPGPVSLDRLLGSEPAPTPAAPQQTAAA